MSNNLSLVGSEIVNGNNNISNTPTKTERIITKSYRILNTSIKEKTPKKNNIYLEQKSIQNKKGNSLDLSKIMYNDGYILTDAVNSNPGFGLWAIKSSKYNIIDNNNKTKINNTESNEKLLIRQNKTKNDRYNLIKKPNNTINNINNISTIKNDILNTKIDKSLSNSNNLEDTNNNLINEKNKQNKIIIDKLTMKCKDLEQKYLNMMVNYEQKEDLCKNAIRKKKEYEKILEENIEETKIIKEHHKKLFLDNSKLNNVYKNTKNEVDRLLNVMNTDNNTMKNIKEEFESRLKKEENERIRLNNILSINNEEIDSLNKILYGFKDNKNQEIKNNLNHKKTTKIHNINNNIINIKNSSKKKDFQINNLNDIILELEIKISNLKKKISKADEENGKLRNIIRFKEQKDEIEKNDINNIIRLLQLKNENQKSQIKTIKEQNNIIKNMKNSQDYKKRKNKLAKSMSLRRTNT